MLVAVVSSDCEIIGVEVPNGAVFVPVESEFWRLIVAEFTGAVFTAEVSASKGLIAAEPVGLTGDEDVSEV
jgi:hypothetical protein